MQANTRYWKSRQRYAKRSGAWMDEDSIFSKREKKKELGVLDKRVVESGVGSATRGMDYQKRVVESATNGRLWREYSMSSDVGDDDHEALPDQEHSSLDDGEQEEQKK